MLPPGLLFLVLLCILLCIMLLWRLPCTACSFRQLSMLAQVQICRQTAHGTALIQSLPAGQDVVGNICGPSIFVSAQGGGSLGFVGSLPHLGSGLVPYANQKKGIFSTRNSVPREFKSLSKCCLKRSSLLLHWHPAFHQSCQSRLQVKEFCVFMPGWIQEVHPSFCPPLQMCLQCDRCPARSLISHS